MLAPPPLPRNKEAAFRDLDSERERTRADAIGDVVRHAQGDAELAPRAEAALVRLLEKDPAEDVRARAASALADIGAKGALAALLVAVEDPSLFVGQMALSALGDLRDPRATARVRRARRDPRAPLRYQAVIAFDKLADSDAEAEESIVDALADDDGEVRYIALRVAEERFSERGAIPAAVAARAEACLEHPGGNVPVAAAILLARARCDAGKRVILEVIRGERNAPIDDEREAVELAGVLGLVEAKPDLERRAFGLWSRVKDTCKIHAKVALTLLGDARAEADLEKLPDPLRVEAREAVARGRRGG